MQPAQPPHRFHAGAEIEVIGIAEQDLDSEIFQQVLRHAFYGRERADRHKDGSFDLAVGRDKSAYAARAANGINVKGD